MSNADEKPAPRAAARDPVPYTLLFPVELRNKDGQVTETITELTLNRINGAAQRKCLNAVKDKGGGGDFAAELVCASARIPPSTYNVLDAQDANNLLELAMPFFSSGRATP